MSAEPDTGRSDELEVLRARVDSLERELVERTARANAAVAAAEDRSYWLDRWQPDLNSVMGRPWARAAWTAARVARALLIHVRGGPSLLRRLPDRVREIVAEERAAGKR